MNGNNEDGDGCVTVDVFSQYKNDQASLCKSYRNHFETKVTGLQKSISDVEKSIIDKIKILGFAVSSIVTILTLINVYLSLVK